MSNVSTVSPYSNTSSTGIGEVKGGAAVLAAGAAVGAAVAVAQWLAEETIADRATVDKLHAERRQERLSTGSPRDLETPRSEPLRLMSAGLYLRNADSLVRAAEKLGYRMEPLVEPKRPLAQQTRLLLKSKRGERLAIEQSREGRLTLHTTRGEERIQQLVRQHTLDRAIDHLRERGMDVRAKQLANGETQILAHEPDRGQRGGAAEVKAQVRTDGTVRVDIDCVKGNRCETIVNELAEAVGGEVTHVRKKEAYFQLPGEPTRIRQQV